MLIILVYYFASKQWWSSQQAAPHIQLTDGVTSVSAGQRTLASVNHYSNETKQQKRRCLHSSVLLSRVVQERNARADASFSQRYSKRPLSHDSHARTDDRDDQCVFMPPSAVISTQCFKQGLMDTVPPVTALCCDWQLITFSQTQTITLNEEWPSKIWMLHWYLFGLCVCVKATVVMLYMPEHFCINFFFLLFDNASFIREHFCADHSDPGIISSLRSFKSCSSIMLKFSCYF